VAVEKVQFPPKQPKFGGYKMPRKLRRSFVGHPSAILFLWISWERVFQQPRLFYIQLKSVNKHSLGLQRRHGYYEVRTVVGWQEGEWSPAVGASGCGMPFVVTLPDKIVSAKWIG